MPDVVALAGAAVVTPRGVLDPGWVEMRAGLITDAGSGHPPSHRIVDLGGGWLLPGFIDLHMHGGGGHDVGTSKDALAEAIAFHHNHGTTRTLASLVTMPLDTLVEQLGWIATHARDQTGDHGRLIGAHLEGPFLAPSRCGAQDTRYMRMPDRDELARLLRAGHGSVRVVTLAPELPGALELIADIVTSGAVAAIGHTDATYEQTRAAIRAGARLATHLFNGMPPLHHRDPGTVGACLDAGIGTELILDGHHLHPSCARLAARGGAQPILITDAVAAAGSGDGEYRLGSRTVEVRRGVARAVDTGSLAGSTLTMDAALRFAVRQVGWPIEVAAQAAAGAPAQMLGLGELCGAIAPGLAADLVHLDENLRPVQVITAGAFHQSEGKSSTDVVHD